MLPRVADRQLNILLLLRRPRDVEQLVRYLLGVVRMPAGHLEYLRCKVPLHGPACGPEPRYDELLEIDPGYVPQLNRPRELVERALPLIEHLVKDMPLAAAEDLHNIAVLLKP